MPVPADGDGADHPDLAGVAAEMRAQWRDEQESATADAAAQLRHGRSLAEWLRDRMHSGDRIAATVVGQTFTGLVEEVGDDLVALRVGSELIEIHVCSAVAISFEMIEHVKSGGTRGAAGRQFRDALLARDARLDARVGTVAQPGGLDGTLFVGRDFVTVVTRLLVETVTPIAHVAWVTAQPQERSTHL